MARRLNKTYFNGSLPDVPIIIKDRKVKVIQGYLHYGKDKRTHPEIVIYSCWNKDIEILVHELLHLDQFINKLPIRHDKQFLDRERIISANIKSGTKKSLCKTMVSG